MVKCHSDVLPADDELLRKPYDACHPDTVEMPRCVKERQKRITGTCCGGLTCSRLQATKEEQKAIHVSFSDPEILEQHNFSPVASRVRPTIILNPGGPCRQGSSSPTHDSTDRPMDIQ